MGVIYMPEPKREPQRPSASATEYPPGTKWKSADGSIWEIEWDDQDKRYAWFIVSDSLQPAVERAQAVETGQPPVQLLACKICGVLLWDIDAHYAHAHPTDVEIRRQS